MAANQSERQKKGIKAGKWEEEEERIWQSDDETQSENVGQLVAEKCYHFQSISSSSETGEGGEMQLWGEPW